LRDRDPVVISGAFTAIEWNKPVEKYLAEQSAGVRDVLVATVDEEFTGYVTMRWQSAYLPPATKFASTTPPP
jgi:hypothetical protein